EGVHDRSEARVDGDLRGQLERPRGGRVQRARPEDGAVAGGVPRGDGRKDGGKQGTTFQFLKHQSALCRSRPGGIGTCPFPKAARGTGSKRCEQRGEPHGNLLCECGLLYNGSDSASGAQTERRGGAGPVGGLLGGKDPTGRFYSRGQRSEVSSLGS